VEDFAEAEERSNKNEEQFRKKDICKLEELLAIPKIG
jgi:hypothetical protein